MTRNCIRSLRAQDVPVHILAIDNGSSDGCSALLRSLAGPDLTLVTHAKRQDLNRVWNWALDLAFNSMQLDYALVVNNDTVLREDTYRLLRDDGSLFVTAVGQSDPVEGTVRLPLEELQLTRRPHPDFSCFLIRRECWERVGKFDECFHAYCADGSYHLRMHRAGIGAWSLPIPFQHIASGTIKNASNALRDQINREAEEDRATFERMYGFAVGSDAYYREFA